MNCSKGIVKGIFSVFLLTAMSICSAFAISTDKSKPSVSDQKSNSGFKICGKGKQAHILVSGEDWPGVIRAAGDLQSDIERVTGSKPWFGQDEIPGSKDLIIIGTIGKSHLINRLISDDKIDVSEVIGKWESSVTVVVSNPFPGIRKALVIAGSDKRGTIYGVYELSEQIGVSPWYWWADVPAKHKKALYIEPGKHILGEPSVKYRGIFLNDEAPALTNWVAWKYGMAPLSDNPPVPRGVAAYNSEFYSRIFELILRLKGNYLWPAMWNNAFNEDDTLNAKLADEYGIVMGTSHQEPMLRAQKEWDRRYKETLGYWNWTKHSDTLVKFWREGIRRNRNYESIVTMGLRGADDTEMGPGGPAANMAKLEKIVEVQRKILAEEMNPDVTQIPQMWCLYKEVQDYYNEGLRVPDDITLLWAEDNWGNVRRLPTADERKRQGGAGIYYHFDYHGGPRSYQWINTNPIPKIWDQMSLSKQYGADRIWIVNVGHFKGYEFPLEFFLDLAWDTEKIKGSDLDDYTVQWATDIFGPEYAEEIASLVSQYTRYNGRRKPELLSPTTYSLVNYHEAETVVADYKDIADRAEEISGKLPANMRDAFYQLVLFPVKASALVNELYFAAGRNMLYAKQGRATTDEMALQTQLLFQADTSLMNYYNRSFAGGKWNHFMDQTHLGYTNWADPPFNSLRHINLKHIRIQDSPSMGLAVEGSEESWPGSEEKPALPEFDRFNRQTHYLEVFNRGKNPFDFSLVTTSPWIILGKEKGKIWKQERIEVKIDWDKVPSGTHSETITLNGTGEEIAIEVIAKNPEKPSGISEGFIEGEGFVSIEAEHYTFKTDPADKRWERIEGYGKTLSAMRATAPVDAAPAVSGRDAPYMEYQMYLFTEGEVTAHLVLSPTLNFIYGRDLRIGISFDDGIPQIITVVPGDFNAQNGNADWERTVMDNARHITSKHKISTEGIHKLKIWMIDPGVVIEKIVIDTGGLKPSYLGPPESYRLLLR